MNRTYYEEVGIEPSYSNEHLMEQVYDDRELEDDDEAMDWAIAERILGDSE